MLFSLNPVYGSASAAWEIDEASFMLTASERLNETTSDASRPTIADAGDSCVTCSCEEAGKELQWTLLVLLHSGDDHKAPIDLVSLVCLRWSYPGRKAQVRGNRRYQLSDHGGRRKVQGLSR